MNKIFLAGITAALISGGVYADNKPLPITNSDHILNVAFDPNNVVPIFGTPMVATSIMFGKDEHITGAVNGDITSWDVTQANNSPNLLVVKPTRVGSNTNLTVYTDKRTYFFHLESVTSGNKKATYALIFKYPNLNLAKINAQKSWAKQQKDGTLSSAQAPHNWNFNYTFNGDKSIMPIQVFSDGKFTYFEFRNDTPQPAIFAVDSASGDEAVVNVRRSDTLNTPMGERSNIVTVLRVAPQFTLRLGKQKVASIFNKPLIQKVENGDA